MKVGRSITRVTTIVPRSDEKYGAPTVVTHQSTAQAPVEDLALRERNRALLEILIMPSQLYKELIEHIFNELFGKLLTTQEMLPLKFAIVDKIVAGQERRLEYFRNTALQSKEFKDYLISPQALDDIAQFQTKIDNYVVVERVNKFMNPERHRQVLAACRGLGIVVDNAMNIQQYRQPEPLPPLAPAQPPPRQVFWCGCIPCCACCSCWPCCCKLATVHPVPSRPENDRMLRNP